MRFVLIGLGIYSLIVVLVCAFIVGASRKKTPRPTVDDELRRLVEDDCLSGS